MVNRSEEAGALKEAKPALFCPLAENFLRTRGVWGYNRLSPHLCSSPQPQGCWAREVMEIYHKESTEVGGGGNAVGPILVSHALALSLIPQHHIKPGVMAQAWEHSTQEVEVGGSPNSRSSLRTQLRSTWDVGDQERDSDEPADSAQLCDSFGCNYQKRIWNEKAGGQSEPPASHLINNFTKTWGPALKYQASLGHIVSSKLTWPIEWDTA